MFWGGLRHGGCFWINHYSLSNCGDCQCLGQGPKPTDLRECRDVPVSEVGQKEVCVRWLPDWLIFPGLKAGASQLHASCLISAASGEQGPGAARTPPDLLKRHMIAILQFAGSRVVSLEFGPLTSWEPLGALFCATGQSSFLLAPPLAGLGEVSWGL